MPSSLIRNCSAVGCRASLLPWGIFCDRCWALVPSDLRKLIEKHARNRKRPSAICQKYIDQAVAEVLYVKTNGRPAPSPLSFDFDDHTTPPAAGVGPLLEKA